MTPTSLVSLTAASSFRRHGLRTGGLFLSLLVAAGTATLGCDSSNGSGSGPRVPGQTDFETEGPTGGSKNGEVAVPGVAGGATTSNPSRDAAGQVAPPSGRTGPVEEADIYRIDQNRLFYLNTYRGFLIYDINDPKNPKQVSRLPVFGYPVEMFIQGNTVYALLQDVLYMTEVEGKVQFKRHDVSQLVAIDITDIAHPQVLQTVDIVGQLREGVSRKIENTVYVVSYIPQSYYWGWRYELPTNPQQEQAWVYSFNVADPRNVKLVQKLKLFEGGSVSDVDPVTGGQVSRSFNGVSLSATSNALMVVENWYLSSWTPGASSGDGGWSCGAYAGDQRAIVSVVDISDPAGAIRLHAHFQTRGQLSDQFKQTYVYDDAAKTGTYYGIFGRQAWSSTGCTGQSFIQNSFESWDVTNGAAPTRLSTLDFGKPNETVRGSTFDVARKAAFAVTAQSIDPLYVLSFADRNKLAIRSAIDGLSGDMTLFRLVENNNFLVGIGRDTSTTCTGLQGTEARRGVGMALSLIDVRNLDAIRLVQRQCVAVDADWVSSEITWNMDQAHKMIGLQSDGTTNVITIPVSYSKRTNDNANGWWWYTWETAVGIMSWDLTKYDPAKAPADQTVIQNFGTYIHPNGEVRRSIVFTHQEATPRRMMANLSDTHISIADIQDLAHPVPQSVVEIAPYVGQIFQFGDYVVESISESPNYWAPQDGRTEFRIKKGGTESDAAPIVARFSASQVQSSVKHGDKLVVFRSEQDLTNPAMPTYGTQALVFDLSDPTKPRLAGSTRAAVSLYPYYPFFCGVGWGYWYRYGQSNWTATTDALVFMQWNWDQARSVSVPRLVTLNLADPTNPAVTSQDIPARSNGYFSGLAPDALDPSGFFMTYQDNIGQVSTGGITFWKTRNYAQRYGRASASADWTAGNAINLPGALVRTWGSASGERQYLTSDYVNYSMPDANGNTIWRSDTRLNLLRATTVGGRAAAELTDTMRFQDRYVGDLIVEGNTLFVNSSPSYYGWYGVATSTPARAGAGSATGGGTVDEVSDRLTIFDLSKQKFTSVYDQPTGTQNVQMMGTYQGHLFLNLQGDGVLAVDVTNPAQPKGRKFLRTLGWTTHLVFVGDDAYAAAGYFGVYRLNLQDATGLPIVN